MDFEALETGARRRAMKVTVRVIEKAINADHNDYAGATRPCPCGGRARYAGRRKKVLQSSLGKMTLVRAYYHCGKCGRGFYPRDRALGVEDTWLSPAVTRMIGVVGAMEPFEDGSRLLSELAGLDIDAKQVERTAKALGREIEKDEREHAEPAAEAEVAATMYMGMDGTGVPMRKEDLEGRPGKQSDGTSKTREMKLCTVWTAEGRDEDGIPVRDEGSVTYTASIESAAMRDDSEEPSDFAKRCEREAIRRGFDRAVRQVVLGDGAPWIWNLVTETFPDAIQILDRFHAKQHLSDVAKAIYGVKSDLGDKWAKHRHEELDAGQVDDILAALHVHADGNEEARKCISYIETNRSRMRYPEFHAAGLCTSSGVVEAGCKVVVGHRLKRAGMHWSVLGSNAIAALRCHRLSHRFEDFWERHAGEAD